MIHSELIKKASRWLQTQGCGVVITEMTSSAGQEPDAIGWTTAYSILIECKVSHSDFLNDRHKCHQRIDKSMGDKRYYLAPKGIIKPEELPDGWGLLEPREKSMRIIKSAGWFYQKKSVREEITLLVSAMRRIRGVMPNGVSAKCYQYKTKNRATIGIEKKDKD